jgi:predicted  nucleic acid-binding Zn-ribbon protein
MKFCPECGTKFISGTEKFCSNCGFNIIKGVPEETQTKNNKSINISNTDGSVSGVDVSGSGNIIGEHITVSQTIYKKLEPEFRDSIDEFLTLIGKHTGTLEEDQKRSLNESIDSLAKLVEGLKSGQVVESQEEKDEIKSKQITLAEKIVNYLPKVAESIASVTPLAPFSKVIGEGAGYFAEWIRRKLAKK